MYLCIPMRLSIRKSTFSKRVTKIWVKCKPNQKVDGFKVKNDRNQIKIVSLSRFLNLK